MEKKKKKIEKKDKGISFKNEKFPLSLIIESPLKEIDISPEELNILEKGAPYRATPITNIQEEKIDELEVAKKMVGTYNSAKSRDLECNLSFSTIKKLMGYKKCYYTGKEFTEEGNFSRTFDRVDNSKGYVEGNVVACTSEFNHKKSNLTVEEIKTLYIKVVLELEKNT